MSPALRVAMDEALLLDRQGFIIPPAAQNLALQQRHYVGLADLLGAMLTSYHQVRPRKWTLHTAAEAVLG